MDKLFVALLLLAASAVGTTAFVTPNVHFSASKHTARQTNVAPTSLSLSSSPNNNNNNKHSEGFLKSRTDIRYFLTQRSIQSFVHLLNHCREEHTVRWLEEILEFPSIDNFHGTGAFNQTKFPEWDSIFLDCVDRPEEVTVIKVRQRRRQQRLSGYNAYFESLKQPQQTPKDSSKENPDDNGPYSKATRKSFSAKSYLDSMTPVADPGPKKKPTMTPWKSETNQRLSSASSYLENLSEPTSPPKENASVKKEQSKAKAKKIRSLAKDIQAQNGTSLLIVSVKNETMGSSFDVDNTMTLSSSETPETKPFRRMTSPGKGTNYLESLSAGPTASTASGEEKPKEEEKIQQSTETSKNPYLEEKVREYELTVDPPALVRRILSVREQISKEWVEDLDMLMKLNDDIAETFEEYNKANANEDEEDEDGDGDDDIQSRVRKDRTGDDTKSEASLSDMEALLKAFGAFIDTDAAPAAPPAASSNDGSTSDMGDTNPTIDPESMPKRQTVFDRKVLSSWTQLLWSPKRSSSPYRKGNFDLLLLLATQESIHRVLKAYKEDDAIRPEVYEWLVDFYRDNVSDYFDGHQTHARSEDFLEEMTKLPRTLIETKSSKFVAWIDPCTIAEDIVRERSEVALDWMKIAETIPEEHTDLRRLLFTNMVSKTLPEESLSDSIIEAVDEDAEQAEIREIPTKDIPSNPTEIFGAFE